MTRRVTLVVHGHFYQPPRENPWTGEVAREPSAAPFHDWNARIAAECYRPNAFARIIDSRNRLVSIVDNYRLLSYDLGPTLLSWLERHDPVTYRRLIAADLAMDGGMAQGFGHLILPLCNQRDLRTQIRWGITDFEFRYGRRAEGMWLPEAAVNDTVLQVLAEEGIQFTLLAPGQGIEVTTLARYLREHRPEDEVKVRESSWSCAHGVGRWREDCGCSTGGEPGWNQRWRAPLREALDSLADRNASVFERLGAQA